MWLPYFDLSRCKLSDRSFQIKLQSNTYLRQFIAKVRLVRAVQLVSSEVVDDGISINKVGAVAQATNVYDISTAALELRKRKACSLFSFGRLECMQNLDMQLVQSAEDFSV